MAATPRGEQVGRLLVGVDAAGGLGGRDRGRARPAAAYGGPAASQCRATSVSRPGCAGQHLGDPGVHPGPPAAREAGVRPCRGPGRGRSGTGRRRPRAPARRPAPGRGRSSRSSSSQSRTRGQGGQVELRGRPPPPTRSAPDGLLGQAAEPPGEDVLHRGRRVLLGQQRGQVAALARRAGRTRRGRTGCRRCAARSASASVVGRASTPATAVDDLAGLGRAEPGQLEPHRVPPGQRLGHLGQRAGRRGLRGARWRPPAAGRLRGLGEQPQHPQRRGVGPVQVVEHHEQVLLGGGVEHRPRDRLPGPELRRRRRSSSLGAADGRSCPSSRSTCAHGHSGGAPSSCEHRPTSTVAPSARAAAASSAHSRLLPMPGSPVTTAKTGCSLRLLEQPDQRGELVVAADQRPARTAGRARRRLPRCCGIGWAAVHASAGSWRSTAVCRSRSSAPGSSPSSSASTSRTWRSTSSASACRPDRVSASARSPQSRSRSGYVAVSASSSPATVACRPSASAATARSSSATARSSSSRARSASAAGASSSSA